MYKYECPVCGHVPLDITKGTNDEPASARCEGCGKAYPYLKLTIERVGKERRTRRELLASDGHMTYSVVLSTRKDDGVNNG
jgi:uncharacterized Zn finger protein